MCFGNQNRETMAERIGVSTGIYKRKVFMLTINVCKNSLIILFSLCFPLLAFTVKVVEPDGTPLSGVKVSFKTLDTTFTTNETGEISAPVAVKINPGFSEKGLQFSGKTMKLLLPVAQNVDIRFISLNGKCVYQYSAWQQAGLHTITVPHLSEGMYLLCAALGSQVISQKFTPAEGFSHSERITSTDATEYKTNAALAKSLQVADTVSFTMAGKVTVKRAISDYGVDLGTIVLAPEKNYGNWFGFEKLLIDTVNPSFVHILFRAYDENGYGRTAFDSSRINCTEDGQPIASESKFIVQKANAFTYKIKTVLLLDNSSSIGDSLSKIREAAKVMVRTIGPYQRIAVFAFSSALTLMQNFTSDTAMLIAAIDKITLGDSSTSLYGSLSNCLSRFENSADIRQFKLNFGNVVIFTDGRETAGDMTLEQLLNAKGTKQVYAIGLGKEIDIPTLKKISGGLTFAANNTSALSDIFASIQQEIVATAGSFWWAHYRSPARGNKSHTLKLTCSGNTNTDSSSAINDLFWSNGFVDGWPPVADSLNIVYNATKDTLIGSYKFFDIDGRAEGTSVVEWYSSDGSNTYKIGTGLKLAVSAVPSAGNVIFKVQPVAMFDSAITGSWASASTTTFKVTQPANGTIDWTPKKDIYLLGDTITLTASPFEGCYFLSWGVSVSGVELNPAKFVLGNYNTISATIAPPCTLMIKATNGTVTKSPDKTRYVYGDTVTLTATPDSGYEFTSWSGNVTVSTNPLKLVMKWDPFSKTSITTAYAFMRTPIVSADPVKDVDGNVYQTVKIGSQVWAVENLRTTKYNDGTEIPLVTSGTAWAALTTPGFCYYNNTINTDSIKKFGALYNYYAVDTKKLAPAGWHVPTESDWEALKNYLIAHGYNYDGTTEYNKIAKALAAKTDWNVAQVNQANIGNCSGLNNTSGFSALGGGCRNKNGYFNGMSFYGYWWSSNEYYYDLSYQDELLHEDLDYYLAGTKNLGFSVRLVQD